MNVSLPVGKVFATYGMQVGGFVARIASVSFVLPLLAGDATLFGVYSVCASILFFVYYADLGFLSAAKKFAAASNASGDVASERRYLSFALFVSLLGSAAIGIACAWFSLRPELLLSSTAGAAGASSQLLLLTAAALPFLAAQRVVMAVFEIRIEGYLAQGWSIASSLATTLAGLAMLQGQASDRVVPFFALSQVLAFLGILGMSATSRRRYGYGILDLLKQSGFDREIFAKTLSLSATGIWVTIFWVFFYELDLLYIGKFHGVGSVAIYSVALTFAGVLRTFQGILFLPIVTHINRIVESAGAEDLRQFLRSTILDFAPIVVIPIVTLAMLVGPVVDSWVGVGYRASAKLIAVLILPMLAGSFAYPWGALLVANERNLESRWISAAQAFAFWIIVFWLGSVSLVQFAALKAGVLLATSLYGAVRLVRILEPDSKGILPEMLKRIVPGSIVAAFLGFLFSRNVRLGRSASDMLQVASACAGILAIAFAVQLLCSADLRSRFAEIRRGGFH